MQLYQAPARVSGEKILMLNDGDDIWTYSPRTSRVRHLATHMKKARVMGSDFAYEDFGGGDYLKKFTIKLLGEEKMEGVACHKLEMIPTSEGPSYAKEIVWVGKTDFIPRRVDYYDDEGLLKNLSISQVKMVQDRATPMEYVMENKREGGQTAITVMEMDYQAEVNENMFTERGLKK
jgi:outer membrane lipoprotein-sorting protein